MGKVKVEYLLENLMGEIRPQSRTFLNKEIFNQWFGMMSIGSEKKGRYFEVTKCEEKGGKRNGKKRG
jgi:hypothetical protein